MPSFMIVFFGLGALCLTTFILSFSFKKTKKMWVDLRYMF